jgi:hypothetical protein
MADASVTVVSRSRVFNRRATMAVASTGAAVQHLDPEPEAIERGQRAQDIYILDADVGLGRVRDLLRAIEAREENSATLIVARELDSSLLVDLLRNHGINIFMGKHGKTASRVAHVIDQDELIVTCNKIIRGDIFGIEKYVPTWGVEINHRVIWDKIDKFAALGALEEYLIRIDVHQGLQPVILSVADELLMNAIYNAPRDASGAAKYAQLPRRQPLALEHDEGVDLHFVCSGPHLVISVTDRFGSLNRGVISRYLTRGLRQGRVGIEHKKFGAGIGLHLAFNSTTQLVFNIDEGERTEVIAVFYIRGGTKPFRMSGRSLGIFIRDQNQVPA